MAVISEIVFVFLLILLNGVLAMSEIAVVTARRAWLRQRAEAGDRDARLALELADAPERFLATVQIGITLVGILAGAFAGATLAEALGTQIRRLSVLAPYSGAIAIGVVVIAITYFSLVLGELVPKRIALGHAESIALRTAAPMRWLSAISYPVVELLSLSTQAVMRMLGVQPSSTRPVTEEELRILIQEGAEVGTLEKTESDMVEHVFRLGDRRISALMTHRTDIIWLDLDDSPEETACKITESVHSHFPVARGRLDNVMGIVRANDLLACGLADRPLDLEEAMYPPLFLPEGTLALKALEQFKARGLHIALVIDEFGGIQGLVTATDILEAIVGDIPEMGESYEPEAVQRQDGSWLLDGLLPIDEFREIFQMDELPGEAEGHYETLGGFVMKFLGRIPSVTDQFHWRDLDFEVVDMDGYRVDKVLVNKVRDGHPKRQLDSERS